MSATTPMDTTTTTTEGNFRNPNKKIFHGRGLELNNNFMDWWSEARKSEEPPTPYEFLTNFGMIGDSGSPIMMEMFWKILLNSPGTPGRLDYYAYYLKDALKTDPTGYGYFESLQPSREECNPDSVLDVINDDHYVTEEEIKSLFQVLPPLEEDLRCCIQRGYSLDLVNYFFEKTSEGTELNLTLDADHQMDDDRRVLDKSLMMVIQKHIGKIKSIKCFDTGDGDDEFLWTKDAFAQFLGMMMQNEGPSKFHFFVPEIFHTGLDGENDLDLRQALPDKKVISNTEEVKVVLSHNIESLNLAILELVPRMAALKELYVTVGPHLKSAAPYLVQSLQSATVLENLCIYNGLRIEDPHVCADSLLAVLEALRTNSSLVKFFYEQRESEAGMDLCESKILDILKLDNSTLQCIKLDMTHDGGKRRGTFVKAVREKIDYCLMLNRHGRQKAREPELQLADFIGLLGDVNGKVLDSNQALNVMFGLLQERPGLWNRVSSIEGRKRKRSNQASCQQNQRHVPC